MRDADLELVKWAHAKNRKPLLVRGARQVGKTFSVEKLGRECFEVFYKIDFKQELELKVAFDLDLVPERAVVKKSK